MKLLILAAGYATRLYPLTLNKAKPLLPVVGKPVIEHIIERAEEIDELDQILVVTNEKFFRQFRDWNKQDRKIPVRIINDQSLTESDRLGAIGDMDFVIKKKKIDDDLLVIAGDNLFELGLREFVDFAKLKVPASSIGLYNLPDQAAVKRYSQVRLDAEQRVIEFEEKPQHPTSTLVAKCIYFFPRRKLNLISEYIASGGSTDQPGYYISWLCRRDSVYGFVFSGRWFDIGNYKIYQNATRYFTAKEANRQEKGDS